MRLRNFISHAAHPKVACPELCTAFFAFFARVSSGVGPLFALFILDLALLIPVPRLRSFFALAGLSFAA